MEEYVKVSDSRRGKIVIADDSDISRGILKSSLRKKYDIIEAKNGLDVIEILNSDPGEIQCILLDILMPVMSGLDVLAYMKDNGILDRIPAIAVTAISDTRGKIACYQAGALAVLEKPCDEFLLPHIVERYITLFSRSKAMRDQSSIGAGNSLANYYTAVLDSLPQAVFILNPLTNTIKYCNAKFMMLPGVSGSPIDRPICDFLPPSHSAEMQGAIADLLKNHLQRIVLLTIGNEHFSVLFNAILNDSGVVTDLVGTIVNVTDDINHIADLERRLFN